MKMMNIVQYEVETKMHKRIKVEDERDVIRTLPDISLLTIQILTNL